MKVSLLESAKEKASIQAVEQQVVGKEIKIVGIGSGSTVVYAVKRLGELQKQGSISIKACIPSSFQAQQLILEAGLPLCTLNEYPVIDVAFDGADEVDDQGNCIKGGGGCQLQEKLVIANAKKWFVVADYRKESQILGGNWVKGVPIEVIPMAYKAVSLKLEKMGGCPVVRMAINKAGPVVTDNGMFLLDTVFPEHLMKDPVSLDQQVTGIAGVVETGLFCGMADGAYFGMEDGSVKYAGFK